MESDGRGIRGSEEIRSRKGRRGERRRSNERDSRGSSAKGGRVGEGKYERRRFDLLNVLIDYYTLFLL